MRVDRDVRPFRLRSCREARSVIEVAAGRGDAFAAALLRPRRPARLVGPDEPRPLGGGPDRRRPLRARASGANVRRARRWSTRSLPGRVGAAPAPARRLGSSSGGCPSRPSSAESRPNSRPTVQSVTSRARRPAPASARGGRCGRGTTPGSRASGCRPCSPRPDGAPCPRTRRASGSGTGAGAAAPPPARAPHCPPRPSPAGARAGRSAGTACPCSPDPAPRRRRRSPTRRGVPRRRRTGPPRCGRPPSSGSPSSAITGCGLTPAVQTTVRAGTTSPVESRPCGP